MRSSSVWPGASILPFWNVSTARRVSGPSPPGRQNRPDSQPKKNRTFPTGNALLYILDIRTASDFFQTRRTFRGAPFSLAVQLVSVAPFAGGETADFGIAQIYLLGVDHTAAARIRVVFGAATGGDPNHDANSCVRHIGQSTTGIFCFFCSLLGCSSLSGSSSGLGFIDSCW